MTHKKPENICISICHYYFGHLHLYNLDAKVLAVKK